ncbi:hypothetical protein R3P38DRAFT_1876793 [Favolaschia claudopus]|uniref:phytol kinase n=1 Tax=Favolaschia claudopus TaxID=2862362 RepID=A0AAW0D8V9_9AGAR
MNGEESRLYNDALHKYGFPKNHPLTPSQFRTTLKLLRSALASPCQTVSSIWGPIVALQCTTAPLFHVPTDFDNFTSPRALIQNEWSAIFDECVENQYFKNIWRWMQFLHLLGLGRSGSSPASHRLTWGASTLVQKTLANLIFVCYRLPGYSICHWFSEAGGLGMLGQIWCFEAECPLSAAIPVLLPFEEEISSYLHFALISWSRDSYDANSGSPFQRNFGEQFMKVTKKTPQEVASAGLAHVNRETAAIAERRTRKRFVYSLPVLQLLSRHEPIQHQLLAQHSIHIVTRALVRVLRPRRAIHDEMSEEAVTSVCSSFVDSLKSGDGISCVIRALEAGFLQGILAGFRPAHWEYYPLLSRYLPCYLVYLSVVRAAAKALKKIRKARLEQRMERAGPIFEAWETFKQVLEERIELAGAKVHLKCGNTKCNRIDYTDNCLRYCLGCMGAAYCSAECQVYHWQHGGHREYCKDVQTRQKEQRKVKISAENLEYLHKCVVERDRIRRTLDVLNITYQSRSLAIEFDYTEFPLQVRAAEDVATNPAYTLVQVKVPCGKEARLLHIKYPMPRDLSDSILN